ncbi:MAG: polysaccharide biosynthesis C-terminal domain-containing protein, partial [Lysobacter spongiicola]|nr:polysaccharide biosynthesis C-terminal domain-containing protein [Lysobacter spongiicola]
ARQDTKTPMRAAVITVVANVVLTIALVTPMWLMDNPYAHTGIAAATALAGILNAALLWRYLRRAGVYQPLPGWLRWNLRILASLVAMAAVVVGLREWIGDWTAMTVLWRWLWLLAVVAAGAGAYGAALLALGLRPRHLRH